MRENGSNEGEEGGRVGCVAKCKCAVSQTRNAKNTYRRAPRSISQRAQKECGVADNAD